MTATTDATPTAHEPADVPVEAVPVAGDAAGPAGPDGSDDRLWTEAAKLRSRGGVPLDRWLQIAGAVLPLLGVLALLGGWYGVSHTARVWRQTPYVVSGGLLGLGLIFLGGFAYFAYWLTKIVEQSQRQTAVLERIEAALTGREHATGADDEIVVAADGVVHRADCPLLAGRQDVRPASPGGSIGPDARTCPVCRPALAAD